MKIRFWGVRGSIPSPGPSTLGYGGNTSCAEVLLKDGTRIIVDAGSGLRPLGVELGSCDAVLLLSHYHWDHIQGMPFFGPAYSPNSSIQVLGPEVDGMGPVDLLSGQMLAPYFPAPASQWLGIISSEVVTEGEPFAIGTAVIRAAWMSHPGPTFGFRFDEGNRTIVYMSDNEVDLASPEAFQSMVELCAGADMMLHDCQYFETEYRSRRGWGHSTPRQIVRIAKEAGVRQLMLFHHDPGHSDEQVELLGDEVRRLAGDIEVLIGREGDTLVYEDEVVQAPTAVMTAREAV